MFILRSLASDECSESRLLASLPPLCLYSTEARLGRKNSGPFKQSLIREDLFLFISTCPENTHYPKVVKIL